MKQETRSVARQVDASGEALGTKFRSRIARALRSGGGPFAVAGTVVRSLRGAVPPRPPRFMSTSNQLRADYERDGFVAGGPLLDSSLLDALRADFERRFAEGDRSERRDAHGRPY